MVVELIAKDKNEKLQFEGSCKLRIDSVSKILLVEPKNEEFKMISAMFKWKFVAEKNILFVFAEHDFQDFALIFDNSKICSKVFNVLLEKEAIRGEQKLILQRFLPPFFDEISKNNGTNSKFKEILVDFINKHGEKEEYIQLLKDNSIFDLCYPEGENNTRINLRKRKAKDITNVDENMVSDDIENYARSIISRKSDSFISNRSSVKKTKLELNEKCKGDIIVNKSLYTIIPMNWRRNVTKNYLIIFTTEEKDFCYKFFYSNRRKCYQCSKCYSSKPRFRISATIKNEGKQNEIVYLNNKKHICEPFKYSDLLRASDRRSVMASNFQLIKRKTNGPIIQKMAVFTNDEKSECFEYTWHKSGEYFICKPCRNYNKILVYARIIKNDDTEEECVILGQTEHKCKPIKFVPEDITVKIVKEPNFKLFEIFHHNKTILKLAIYDPENKNLGYGYSYHASEKKYFCLECRYKNARVNAKVLQDENGQNYVEMGKNEHVCEPLEISDLIKSCNRKIVISPTYQLIKRNIRGKIIQHLVIFTNDEKSECFEYRWRESDKYFLCKPCRNYNKICVYARIIKNDETEEECVKLCQTEHKCKPIKFVLETAKIVKEPYFKIWESVFREKKVPKLTIFDSKNKNFGYIYSYHASKKKYYCIECRKKIEQLLPKFFKMKVTKIMLKWVKLNMFVNYKNYN